VPTGPDCSRERWRQDACGFHDGDTVLGLSRHARADASLTSSCMAKRECSTALPRALPLLVVSVIIIASCFDCAAPRISQSAARTPSRPGRRERGHASHRACRTTFCVGSPEPPAVLAYHSESAICSLFHSPQSVTQQLSPPSLSTWALSRRRLAPLVSLCLELLSVHLSHGTHVRSLDRLLWLSVDHTAVTRPL
jgi:hypothetical protein